MRLKTKLWIAAGFVSLMLVIMVGIVYVKGRSTIINIANTEGVGSASEVAKNVDTYVQGLENVINNATPFATSLFAGDGQALQADRVAEKDVRLRPGESVTVDMPMETSVQFVAVAAMFIDPDLTQNSWRLVLTRDELDPARPRIIEASQNQLTLHPFKEK